MFHKMALGPVPLPHCHADCIPDSPSGTGATAPVAVSAPACRHPPRQLRRSVWFCRKHGRGVPRQRAIGGGVATRCGSSTGVQGWPLVLTSEFICPKSIPWHPPESNCTTNSQEIGAEIFMLHQGLDFQTVRVLCKNCGWFRNIAHSGCGLALKLRIERWDHLVSCL